MPRLRCDRCGRDAIVFQRYSGLHLCGDHFQGDLVARVKRTIRAHGWIRSGDRIAVALSGSTVSCSLLHLLSVHFGMRRDISLVAITMYEGKGPGRDIERTGRIARALGIEWAVGPLVAGDSFPGAGIAGSGEGPPPLPSGRLSDDAFVSLAERTGATKLAVGTTLDDEARSVLLKILRGETARFLPGPGPEGDRIPVIRPFLRIPEQDVTLYARLNGTACKQELCPQTRTPLENEVRQILDEYTLRHPGAMFSLVNLGEALSGPGETGSRDSHPCNGSREPSAAARTARGMPDRVGGHG